MVKANRETCDLRRVIVIVLIDLNVQILARIKTSTGPWPAQYFFRKFLGPGKPVRPPSLCLIFKENLYMMGNRRILTMALEEITQKIKQKMAQAAGLTAKVRFDFGDEGCVFVDTTQTPALINDDKDTEADTTLVCSVATFENILAGTQDPNIAFMLGKLKVKGSMGLAMKLNGILED